VIEQHALAQLFDNNRRWAQERRDRDPAFFSRLVAQQTPEYLWIGCSDSRVPANEIIGLAPGEVFVHRNVANLVPHTDFNCLSVLQYAVDVLKVKHVLVVGHYGCGGVRAALEGADKGLIDNWLRNIKDIIYEYAGELRAIDDVSDQADRLCELSVCRQVQNVASTTIVQNAWLRGQSLDVHGLVYSLADGLLKDLGCGISGMSELNEGYRIDGLR
jgi:carbonic anhydrase